MKETIAGVDGTRSQLFEKINKIDISLARLIKKKKKGIKIKSIDVEKVYDKFQHSFMIKLLAN